MLSYSVLKLCSRLKIGEICLVLLLFMLSSCVYRFTNTALRLPIGVRSIAVEAVYDTSREVVPHELIWSAVQKELARNGRLFVTSQNEADALMILTLNHASVRPSGTPSREPVSRDPVITDSEKGRPEDFRNLRRAGSWTTDESVNLTLSAEVIDLKTKTVLFRREYSGATSFKSLRSVSVTSSNSAYLNYEEALQSKVKVLSEQLASRIVSDFLM
ncbi:MAG: hypothetical protein NTX25_18165 [Proteobacteria bacterium]|nr:hypothetical protein [Pseudomonadota bacterium]